MRIAAFVLVAALIAFPFASSANGDIVFEDNFNNNGPLLGSTPGVGGNWTITGTSIVNPLTVTGNVLALANTGQDAFGQFSAPVPTTPLTGIYSGLNINLSAANATGDYFFHLSDPVATTTNFYNRLFARSSGAGFQLGMLSSSTGTVAYGGTVLNLNQDYRVVTSWDFVAGALNDVFNIYVDPTDPTQANNTAYLANVNWNGTGAEPAANVSAVNYRQGTAANAPTLTTDNLTVATTFAQAARLSAVPEPGTAGLAIIGVMGMIGLVRRRTA